MLHVTNGDSFAYTLRETEIAGDVLPWRDVLHEGPAPAGLILDEMSEVRALFLSSCGWGEYAEIRRNMRERDEALLQSGQITLWFEHDLYDQLQLIQILSALSHGQSAVSLICVDNFPGHSGFHGLGELTATELQSLWPTRQPVTRAQYELAVRAWQAFCASDRMGLDVLLSEDLSVLPFVKSALTRYLEEFPSPRDGLSRTERQILKAVHAGASNFAAVFLATQQMEEHPFMGDSVLQMHIESLTDSKVPLLNRSPITLTRAGEKVLGGELNHIEINGINRWLGGVHLTMGSKST